MDDQTDNPNRRGFLKGAVLAGASVSVAPLSKSALASTSAEPVMHRAPGPSPWLLEAESGNDNFIPHPPTAEAMRARDHVAYPGSDFMLDVLKKLDVDYISAMMGSTFRGLQESIVNYGENKSPELIVCVHEEISVAMTHGYAKATGKPMACMLHSNVGLQHGAMAIYNAWCDRVPLIAIVGNAITDETKIRGFAEWTHTAQDVVSMVRDFVKYDDAPKTLTRFAESMVRAHNIAMTPPYEPVAIVADAELQELPIPDPEKLKIPEVTTILPPVGSQVDIEYAAKLLLEAESPVIVADRAARSNAGVKALVELAELLNCPVISLEGRMNFPTRHYLHHSANRGKLLREADIILALELTSLWSVAYYIPDNAHREPTLRTVREDVKIIDISAVHSFSKSNHMETSRHVSTEITIPADAEATIPHVTEAIKNSMSNAQRKSIQAKKPALQKTYDELMKRELEAAAVGWDSTPITTARLCMEVWEQIKNEKWSLVSPMFNLSSWPRRLWDMTEYEHFLGGPGAYGVGYTLPASAGAALAFKKEGRVSIDLQSDGDFMMLPGTLWTLAHHEIPLLIIMHNNRAWHQETMHMVRMANRRGRTSQNWNVGTTIDNPNIDYSKIAESMGVWAEGPITDPEDLAPAIARALEVVKSGKPALLDVVSAAR
jgi:thiamine pyrophosphate-dependent acetolactate synthase large subunit-like protein